MDSFYRNEMRDALRRSGQANDHGRPLKGDAPLTRIIEKYRSEAVETSAPAAPCAKDDAGVRGAHCCSKCNGPLVRRGLSINKATDSSYINRRQRSSLYATLVPSLLQA
jgi:hypothetical protein